MLKGEQSHQEIAFMTMTEKILARAAGKDRVAPGDNVWVNVDVLMTHDVCGPGTIGVFKQHFGKDAKVWDRDKVVIIPDHYIFTADKMANRNVDVLRAVRGRAGPAVLLRRRHGALQGRLPHRPARGGPHPARRGAVRHR